MLEQRIRSAVEALGRIQPEPPPIEKLIARRRRRRQRFAGGAAVVIALAVGLSLSFLPGNTQTTVKVVSPPSKTPVVNSSPTTASSATTARSATTTPMGGFSTCRSEQLSASAYQGSGAGGQESVVVVLKNMGSAICQMTGYPTAWFVTAAGTRLSTLSIDRAAPAPTTVTIPPGGSASTSVWTGSPSVPTPSYCQSMTAEGVRVIPPAQTTSVQATVTITICGAHNVVAATPLTSGPNPRTLVPADSQLPAAGVCGRSSGTLVEVLLVADVPSPRCAKVTADQQLRVVNATNTFGQPGRTLTVVFGSFPPRQLAVGQATLFAADFGTYLAPGVHDLRASPYTAEIWLGNW
jgi:hypothetical protein